jgi:antitoxin ParD1/3/4
LASDVLQQKLGKSCQVCDIHLMPTQNVNLSEQQAKFIRQSVDGGDYRNASEVVRAGLRLLKQQQRIDRLKLRRLRSIANRAFEEIDRGDFEVVEINDLDPFLAKIDGKSRTSKSR